MTKFTLSHSCIIFSEPTNVFPSPMLTYQDNMQHDCIQLFLQELIADVVTILSLTFIITFLHFQYLSILHSDYNQLPSLFAYANANNHDTLTHKPMIGMVKSFESIAAIENNIIKNITYEVPFKILFFIVLHYFLCYNALE